MKKILHIIMLISFSAFSQGLKKPNEGKALVYFVRSEQLGFLINFKYFDGEKYLGKFNYGKYLAYECEPGKHLFWAKSENIDFLEADLEAGKLYIVDSQPQMGAFKAGVKLVPFDNNVASYKNEKKYTKKKSRVLGSITEKQEYVMSNEDSTQDTADLVKRAMEKYNKNKAEGYKQLTAAMDYKE
jgi:hypothetical protein